MLASLDGHLGEKDAAFSIAKILSFPTVQKYLKEKQGFLVNKVSVKGLTLQKRRTVVVQRSVFRPFPSVTDTDHVVLAPPALWFEGLSGAPQHVRWRFCRQHQRQQYWIRDLWGNPTNSRQGGLHMEQRVVQPKMIATSGQRCFVKPFKTFLEWRPEEMQNSGSFYLAVKTQVWCKWQKIGVNSILIPLWRIWQIRQTYKAKSSQTTVLTKPWWRSWKLQTNCGEWLSVCANERSLEDYEGGDENEQWDISSIISAECAMAQSSRVRQLLAKIRCCKHSCGDHFPLQWWKVSGRWPFPWLSTFFLAAVDVWIYM